MVIDHFEPDVVVGLSRGGLTPGIMLSHWLKKPFKPIKAALRDHPEWEDYLPKKSDKKVIIIDDLIATGGTAEAAAKLIEKSGGVVAGFIFVINLFDLPGKKLLEKKGYESFSIIDFPGH